MAIQNVLQRIKLLSQHEEHLKTSSCISSEIISKSELFSADSDLTQQIFKIKSSSGGIVFPYYKLDGELLDCRIRLDNPFEGKDGKPVRYLQPKGTSLTCYFLKDDLPKLRDTGVPLWITEGEKKLLSIASLPESSSVVLASYPGCNNWTEKGSGKLSEAWSSIPLSGRTVLWLPDSDYFTNIKVRRAGDKFLKQIVDAGAIVSIVSLVDEKDRSKKYGTDDFIKAFGAAALLKRLENPLWQFSRAWRDDAESACRELAHLLPAEFCKHAEIISKQHRMELGHVQAIWKKYRQKWNKLRGVNESDPEYYEIDFRDEIPRQEIIRQVSILLRADGRFYRYGTEFLMVNNAEKELLDAVSLPGRINALGVEFTKPTKSGVKYELLPVPLARALLQSSHATAGLPEILLFTNHPTYDQNWRISPPGYNALEQTYYSGERITPIKSQEYLRYIVKDFLLKNDASRCNLVALLLTAILRNKYRGDRPFGALTGNRPGIGKSLASKIVAIIAEGSFPESITYGRNQEELEKQIGARLIQRDVVFVDNVKSSDPVDSPVLERLITDDPISFRKLGHSQTITRPNTSIVLMTMNQATFCTDLISRLLPIEFYLEEGKEPTEKKFSTDSLSDFVKENRTRILQELCGMIEVWKEQGQPLAQREFRFRQWAKEIGGILEVNGFGAFLTNLQTAQSEYSKDTSGLGILFRNILGRAVLVDELLRICQAENLFPEILSARGPAISLANLLGRHLNKTITLPDGNAFVLKNGPLDRHRKVKTYVAEPIVRGNSASAGTCGDITEHDPRSVTPRFEMPSTPHAGMAGTQTNPLTPRGAQSEFKFAEESSGNPVKEPALPAETPKPSVTEALELRGHSRVPCGDAGTQMELAPEDQKQEMEGNDLNW